MILAKPGGTLPTAQPVSFSTTSPGPLCCTFQSAGTEAHDGFTMSLSIFALTVTSVNANCSTTSPLSLTRRALSSSPVVAIGPELVAVAQAVLRLEHDDVRRVSRDALAGDPT